MTTIKTWKERAEGEFKAEFPQLNQPRTETIMASMRAEIAELRAALQAQQGEAPSDEAILTELEIVKAAGNYQSLALVTDKAGLAYARAVLMLAARREG